MNTEQKDKWLADYLGGALDEKGTGELLALVRSDPDALHEVAGLQDIDIMLDALGRDEEARKDLSDRIEVCLADSERRERLWEAVARDIEAPPSRTRARPKRARPARQPTRPWGWWITGLAATILVCLGLVLDEQVKRLEQRAALVEGDGVAQVEHLIGRAVVETADKPKPLARGDVLFQGETLLTDVEEAGAVLHMPRFGALHVQANTRVAFPTKYGRALVRDNQEHVYISHGGIVAEATKLAPGAQFTLGTPHARLQAIGTVFQVLVQHKATRVDVRKGLVQVASREEGRAFALASGQYALIGRRVSVAGTQTEAPFASAVQGPLALYRFDEGHGLLVRDVSGATPPLNLRIEDPSLVKWLPAGGLVTRPGAKLVSVTPAARLVNACKASNALTVETWVRPTSIAHLGASPARIVALRAVDKDDWGFILGQGLYKDPSPVYVMRLSTTEAPDFMPELLSWPAAPPPAPIHLVFTREASGRALFYANGENIARQLHWAFLRMTEWTGMMSGAFSDWSDDFRLLLANVPDGSVDNATRTWLGEYHFVAVYCRAMPAEEIRQRYHAGPTGGAHAAIR
ncbi:MAG: FecR domain-containing protein [Kiritimatiellae bacterium]|nr:FecR domain-containing protein [Kiritimatiellia bacterium]